MEISEVYHLAQWYRAAFPEMRKRYKALLEVLNQNANQQNQSPVLEPLGSLIAFLTGMHLQELSLEQMQALEKLGVADLVGVNGANNVSAIVQTATYDPATVAREISERNSRLNEVSGQFEALIVAIDNLGMSPETFDEVPDHITVRIGFRRDASIDNVKDWKTYADEWYHIIRGLGLALGESPEDTRVVGATKGSLILVLAATASMTKALAIISKHVTGIAKDVIGVRIELENLRQKALLTKTMEAELQSIIASQREKGIAAIEKEMDELFPKKKDSGDRVAFDKAIEKLLAFGEKGGDVDFVAPSEAAAAPDDQEAPATQRPKLAPDMAEARKLVQAYQAERETLKKLKLLAPPDSAS